MSVRHDEAWSRRERWLAFHALVVISACFLVFARLYVPRLNNNVMSDMEFTGWSGPMASRLLAGERPYVDFVLPIPPGSFVVLAFIQRLSGKALLLQELWLEAAIHLALAWLGYAMAALFTTRRVALMVAAATLVTVLQLPKECAYDHTAQLVAWSSIVVGAHALFALPGRRRALYFGSSGFLAGFTLLFKQSTATGVILGWLLALGYLAGMRWREHGRAALRERLPDVYAWATGTAAGGLGTWAVLVVLGAAACFGGATALLASDLRALPRGVLVLGSALKSVPTFGLVAGTVFFVVHCLPSRTDVPGPEREHGHTWNALFLVAMSSTLLHDTSFVLWKPFYQNNPSIPVAIVCLLVSSERAGLRWLTAVLFVGTLGSLFSLKLDRALSADTPVTAGHWAGLTVNYRGKELLAAAARVQQLARPDETVLVLPEDVQLAALFGRPRPHLLGAIVFVDQYARRLAEADIRTLGADPPKVIVRHPRRERDWRRLYATWSDDSGAEDVLEYVERDLIPRRYRRDSSFRTVYFWDQGQLDVWIRTDGEELVP